MPESHRKFRRAAEKTRVVSPPAAHVPQISAVNTSYIMPWHWLCMRSSFRLPTDLTLIVMLAIALFWTFFDVNMLDPGNIGWLLRGTDNGENALGLHAWLNDPHAGLWRTQMLNAPEGVALLFTDSNPLLATIVAPFRHLIGRDFQVVGPWLLACLMLHLGLARALLAPYAPNRWMLWAGVLVLALLPSLYLRQIHVNLCAHWLILWALWIYASPHRASDWRWWIAVLVTAALIHSYLLLMVAAIWGSAFLERLANADGGWVARRRLLAGAVVVVIAVGLILGLLIDRGGFVATGTFGRFGMPLDAPWNPAIAGLSRFLPASAQAPDRQLEAFQYLGAGLLLMIIAMPFALATTRNAPSPATGLHRRLCWLLPAGAVLTLLAISHRVDFAGSTLFTLPLSPRALAALDPVRASARLFWPVAYGLLFAAITAAYRLPIARGRLLMALAVAIQLLDVGGLARLTRAETAAAQDRTIWKRTTDPRWQSAIASARDVTIMPPDATRQLDLFQEIAWRAIDAGRPVRLAYAARTNRVTAARLIAEERAFARGVLDPRRLYVLLPDAPLPPVAPDRVLVLDGVRVILPLRDAGQDAPRGH